MIQNFENLLEDGIANQTMSDIASSLKVSLRTLYEIAPSKEQLVISTIDRILTNIAKQALSSMKDMKSSVDKLRTFTKIGNEAAGPRIQKYADDLNRIKGADEMIKAHESAYIDHIKRLLDEAVMYTPKKNHQKKLAASAEESANMISGLIIDGLIQTK